MSKCQENRTCVEVMHARDKLARIIQPMFTNRLQFPVFGQTPSDTNMHPNHMKASILRRTNKTVRFLHHAHTCHARVMLSVRMPRFARHIPFETRRVPDFHRLVVGTGDEKNVVGRDCDAVDAAAMGSEIGYDVTVDVACQIWAFASGSNGWTPWLPTPRCTIGNSGTKIMQSVSKIVLVNMFENISDGRLLTV